MPAHNLNPRNPLKTSYGQQICKAFIDRLIATWYVENYRPDWLFGMEVDFYFPMANVAIEFNGDQHYFATALGDPSAQRWRDRRKRDICRERGVKLVVLRAIDLTVAKIRGKFKKHLPLAESSKCRDLETKAKEYRTLLKDKFSSPTAHRSKGKAREKTVAKLFSAHPPSLEGKWNADVFKFKWNEWINGKPKGIETVMAFRQAHGGHLRRRHERHLARVAQAWEVGN